MIQATQHDIETLLAQAGAHPPRHGRGKWICPDCTRPALSVNSDKQVFNCHHARCEFHGGIGALRKRLGIRREWIPRGEYQKLCRKRERAHDAAERLYGAVQFRRKSLLDRLHDLNGLEAVSHESGPSEATWDALQMVYSKRAGRLAELAILEDAALPDLVRFFTEQPDVCRRAVATVIDCGGLCDPNGRFIEVAE